MPGFECPKYVLNGPCEEVFAHGRCGVDASQACTFLAPGSLEPGFSFEAGTFEYRAPLDWSGSSFAGRGQPRQAVAPIHLQLPPDLAPEHPLHAGSSLERSLRTGDFVVSCEMVPPASADPAVFLSQAGALQGHADAILIPDNAGANLQMSGAIAAYLLQGEGWETILEVSCRDRNRSQLQADVLGSCALGLKNILCTTGEHPRAGEQPEVKPVFDLDQVNLIRVVHHMREESKYMSGRAILERPEVLIGGQVAPAAPPIAYRLHDLGRKVAAGADFILTNAIFDTDLLQSFARELVELGLDRKVKLLVSIGVLTGAERAQAIQEQVPGVSLPDNLIQRLRAQPPAQQKREGFQIALETIEQVRKIPAVSGINILTGLSGISTSEAAELCAAASLNRRPEAANYSDQRRGLT